MGIDESLKETHRGLGETFRLVLKRAKWLDFQGASGQFKKSLRSLKRVLIGIKVFQGVTWGFGRFQKSFKAFQKSFREVSGVSRSFRRDLDKLPVPRKEVLEHYFKVFTVKFPGEIDKRYLNKPRWINTSLLIVILVDSMTHTQKSSCGLTEIELVKIWEAFFANKCTIQSITFWNIIFYNNVPVTSEADSEKTLNSSWTRCNAHETLRSPHKWYCNASRTPSESSKTSLNYF